MMQRFKYILALGWIAVLALAYFGVFPFTGLLTSSPPHPLRPAFTLLIDVLSLGLIVTGANGWGKPFWGMAGLSSIERFLFATAAGLGFLSLVVLVSSCLGFINSYFYFVLILTGVALLMTSGSHFKNARIGSHYLLLLLLASVPLAASFIAALAPPTQFDSLVYHLALPRQYIDAGRFYAVPHTIFFSFPQNIEMLYQFALVLDGDILANLIGWLFLFLTGTGIYALVRRYAGARIAVVAALLWFSIPGVLLLATGTYVDIGLTFYVFLSVYALLLWIEQGGRQWVYSAGIFAGLALGDKYTAASAVLLVCLLLLLSGRKNAGRAAVAFALISFAVFSPWLIKNAIFLKNPVAPWGTSLFTASVVSPELAFRYFAHIRAHGMAIGDFRDLAILPWNLTVSGFKYGGGFDLAGPAFILFMPLLFLRKKIDTMTRNIILFASGFCVMWLFTGKVMRFLLPVFPFFCILSAQGIAFLDTNRWTRRLSYCFLAIVVAHNILFFHWVTAFIDPYSPVLFGEQRSAYLGRKLNYYRAVSEGVNNLPPGSKVLFFGETRRYYCAIPAIVPTVFDVQPLLQWANAAKDTNELRSALQKEGLTHILINDFESGRLGTAQGFTPAGAALWERFKEQKCRLQYADAYCRLYEIQR
jgi:hypothetical protein